MHPFDIPREFNSVFEIHTRRPSGKWYARNDISPSSSVPWYTESGGGISEEDLTTLPQAIEECIRHVENHKHRCEKIIKKLQAFKEWTHEQV